MPPPTTTVVNERGNAIEATPDTIAGLLAAGYHIEGSSERSARVINEAQQAQLGGVLGTANALFQGAASGATLGATDIASGLAGEGGEAARVKSEHAGAYTLGQLVGGVVGGEAGLLPAGMARGAGEGLAARVATSALGKQVVGAGVEGALAGAGNYVSDVALGDKELSAEGFIAGMGQGALFGAGTVGGLGLTAKALTKARALLPKLGGAVEGVEGAAAKAGSEFGAGEAAIEPTEGLQSLGLAEEPKPRTMSVRDVMHVEPEAAEQAVNEASNAIETHLNDSHEMLATARKQIADETRLRSIQEGAFGGGPELNQTRAAFGGEAAQAAPPQDLESLLAQTNQRMRSGESFSKLSTEGERAKYAIAEPKAGGIPRTAADVTDESAVHTISARDLEARGYYEPPGTGTQTKGKMDRARKAIAEGQRDPVRAVIDPEGRIEITDGRHRLAAAVEADAPVKIRFERTSEAGGSPDIVYRGGGRESPLATSGGMAGEGDLESLLSQTAKRMEGGESFGKLSAEGERAAIIARGERKVSDFEQKLTGHAKDIAEAAKELESATMELESALGRKPGRIGAAPQTLAGKIAGAAEEAAPDISQAINDALTKRTSAAAAAHDLEEVIPIISRHEQAHADLAQVLGDAAPPGASARGKAWYEKLDEQLGKQQEATAASVGHADDAMALANAAGPEAAAAHAGGIMALADKAGTAWELLHDMGIPVPSPSSIPLIGPVLGLFLKARLAMTVAKRMGLRIPETAESVIASKASRVQSRVAAAIDKILETAPKAINAAAPKAAQPAVALAHRLFDDGRRSKEKPTTPEAMLDARRDELAAAMQPGAIDAAVRRKVAATDPELIAQITAATQRKLQYLDSKMPKPPMLPGMLPGAVANWHPAPGQITSFARSANAVDDPAGVLEHLAETGQVTYEAADALRNVYPRLFQEAQKMVLLRAQDQTKPMPYERRVSLSILFRLPLDGTMNAGFNAAMSAAYQAPQGQAPAGQPAQPPTPGMTGDVNLASRTTPKVDQR